MLQFQLLCLGFVLILLFLWRPYNFKDLPSLDNKYKNAEQPLIAKYHTLL